MGMDLSHPDQANNATNQAAAALGGAVYSTQAQHADRFTLGDVDSLAELISDTQTAVAEVCDQLAGIVELHTTLVNQEGALIELKSAADTARTIVIMLSNARSVINQNNRD